MSFFGVISGRMMAMVSMLSKLLVLLLLTGEGAEQQQYLEAEMPAFWPPWEANPALASDEHAYAAIDEQYRRLIEFRWTPAFYDPVCDEESRNENSTGRMIPVYFWPGDRVDLPCFMCRRAFVSNGQVKQWRVLHQIDMLHAFTVKKDDQPLGELKHQWRTLGYVSANAAVDGDYLPTIDPKKRIPKPKARFLQRDGRLIILQASPGIQGVYNCFSKQSRDTNLLYVVMAMTPYTWLKDGRKGGAANLHARCPNMAANDQPNFAAPDLNWQWTFLPSLYTEDNLPDGRLKPRPRPSLAQLNRVVSVTEAEHHTADQLNLGISMVWEEWSACTACAPYSGRRSREGHCYLRKLDSKKPIRRPNLLKSMDYYEWLLQLDPILSRQPFARDGLRLHSSLLVTLAMDGEKSSRWQHNFTACDYDQFDGYAKNFWYGLLDVFVKMSREKKTNSLLEQYQMCLDGYSEAGRSVYVTGYFYDVQPCSDQCH